MFYRSFLGTVLLSTLLVSGCATQPVAKDASPLGPESTPQQQLSDGNRTVITTSQGQISIEPTVVDMEGAETSSEVSAGDGNSIYYDPLESMNRAIFSFNHGAYKYLLIPIARGYKAIIPIQAREKIGNAFSNIREPLNLVSNLAAGNPKGAGTNLGRFLINTTIGLLGLFDPAKYWFDIEPAKQTIADTLSEHNIGNGAYLVIPLLGQSDMRGLTSIIGESLIHPINYLTEVPDTYYVQGVNVTHQFSSQEELYEVLYDQADDPYIFFRNQYLQGVARDAEFKPE